MWEIVIKVKGPIFVNLQSFCSSEIQKEPDKNIICPLYVFSFAYSNTCEKYGFTEHKTMALKYAL